MNSVNPLLIDLSHWQGKKWSAAKAKAAGVVGVLIKISQGNDWKDENRMLNYTKCKEAGLPVGFWHWFEPWKDPIAQAINFLAAIPGPYELGLFGDFEDRYGIPYKYHEKVKAFLDYLEADQDKTPGIYTAYYYWIEKLASAIWADRHDLWLANYDNRSPLTPMPWGGQRWLFWQFTSKGNGPKYGTDPSEALSMDLDVFHGSMPELEAYIQRAKNY